MANKDNSTKKKTSTIVLSIVIPIVAVHLIIILGIFGLHKCLSNRHKRIKGEEWSSEGIIYRLFDDGTAKVDGNSNIANCIIKDTIKIDGKTYVVNCIASGAFKDSGVWTVNIPSTIEIIEESAFCRCKSLKEIEIPDSVKEINAGIFEQCINLKKVVLSSSITCIPENAFSNCVSLEEVILPESINRINSKAFKNCYNMTSIAIPSNVSIIENEAFLNCRSLFEIKNKSKLAIKKGEIGFGGIGLYSRNIIVNEESKISKIDDCFIYKDNNDCTLIRYVGHSESVAIPNGVTIINDNAFYYCSFINEISIPNSVVSIGADNFPHTSIKTCEIPDSVEKISSGCFESCLNLKSVTLGNKITSIPVRCFYNCNVLTEVRCNGIITSIEGSAFSKANNLECINIKEGLKKIEVNAFYDCFQLKEIYLPSTLVEIGDSAFKNCYHLREIYNLSQLNIELRGTTFGEIGLYAIYLHDTLEIESKISTLKSGVQIVADESSSFYAILGYYGTKKIPTLPNNINGHDYIIYDYAFYTTPYFNAPLYYRSDSSNIKDKEDTLYIPSGCIGINKYAINSNFTDCLISTNLKYFHQKAFYGQKSDKINIQFGKKIITNEGSQKELSNSNGWVIFCGETGAVMETKIDKAILLELGLNLGMGEEELFVFLEYFFENGEYIMELFDKQSYKEYAIDVKTTQFKDLVCKGWCYKDNLLVSIEAIDAIFMRKPQE